MVSSGKQFVPADADKQTRKQTNTQTNKQTNKQTSVRQWLKKTNGVGKQLGKHNTWSTELLGKHAG